MEYVVLGGLAIPMLFLLFMSFRTWKIVHIFVMFCVFVASAIFVRNAALVLKTHVAWKKAYADRTRELEEALKEKELLLHGNLLDVDQKEYSTTSAQQELRRQTQERGRVWRDCQLTNANGNQVELNTPAPGPNQIAVNSKLVAFKEAVVPEISDQWKVPVAFLGEFLATAATDTTVTLVPTVTLDADRDREQIAQINARDGTWVLYEKMPLDAHDVFQDMAVDEIQRALPRDSGQTDEQYNAKYEAMIDQYRFDGQPLQQIRNVVETETNRISRVFDPPPARIGIRVKFVQVDEVEVNADVAAVSALAAEPFDTSGRAQLSSLFHVDPATEHRTRFEVGDTAVFDKETADRLIAEGKVELVEPVFVRELVDYAYHFHEIDRQRLTLVSKLEAADRDQTDVQDSLAKVQRQITASNEEVAKLREDLGNHLQEVQLVTQHREKLDRDWAALKDEIRQLYYANKHYESQLVALHDRLSQEVERRTRQALGSGAQ